MLPCPCLGAHLGGVVPRARVASVAPPADADGSGALEVDELAGLVESLLSPDSRMAPEEVRGQCAESFDQRMAKMKIESHLNLQP
eukprot:SAG11_NODE_8482_length_1010_cov_1.087816_3_plen_84_part_01